MGTAVRTIAAVALTAALAFSSACSKPAEQPAAEPKIAPPLIAEAGVLRAGVDLTYPPFAGTDKDIEAGIDIDIAEAIAAQLGLTLEMVQVKPGEATSALDAGTVDIVLSVPLDPEAVMGARIAGTYLADGPAFFTQSAEETAAADAGTGEAPASTEATDTAKMLTPSAFAGQRIAAQRGSPAFWMLEYDLGEGVAVPFETLRAAFEALAADEVDVVVGQASVGTYIARDFDGASLAGQYGPGTALGVAVKLGNDELGDVVRDTLDGLASGGALKAIRATWLGDQPLVALPEGDGADDF
ncbi:MAG: transporter substrate-binding domain-containing protein [Coriobacteriia bacterium]|nr:transporter substrate-binding domain-containing protein [Coriobacteriia bacterium]